MEAAQALLNIAAAYALAGIVFAAAFVGWGVGTIDPAARGASWSFRIMILPGAAALWPWLLVRWIRHRTGSAQGDHA